MLAQLGVDAPQDAVLDDVAEEERHQLQAHGSGGHVGREVVVEVEVEEILLAHAQRPRKRGRSGVGGDGAEQGDKLLHAPNADDRLHLGGALGARGGDRGGARGVAQVALDRRDASDLQEQLAGEENCSQDRRDGADDPRKPRLPPLHVGGPLRRVDLSRDVGDGEEEEGDEGEVARHGDDETGDVALVGGVVEGLGLQSLARHRLRRHLHPEGAHLCNHLLDRARHRLDVLAMGRGPLRLPHASGQRARAALPGACTVE
mmetsp:Transcript_17894/g.36386  ORF Transcript_17894/g.36386 Transcript_17894/m.36386 type:complete len:260 (-) Transcript_17894:1492-2271(-)